MSDSISESDYSDNEKSETSGNEKLQPQPTAKRRGRKRRTTPICLYCKRKFPQFTNKLLKDHAKTCEQRNPLNKCMWCGLNFTNRGNLASHAFHIHGDTSYKSIKKPLRTLQCEACNQTCYSPGKLRYHIRKTHFNLKAKIPHAELKKVNQIWFEKVKNSKKIVEIKKSGHSTLLLRAVDKNKMIKVIKVEQKTIDLRYLYPLEKKIDKCECDYCGKTFYKRVLRKHIVEKHMNLKKFSCNNCNRAFKRSYEYLRHYCHQQRRISGAKHVKGNHSMGIKISSVESFGGAVL